MGDVARHGRTVLFVSHNMGAIMQLCPTSFTVQKGRLASQGPSRQVVQEYLNSMFEGHDPTLEHVPRHGDGRLRFVSCYLRNETGRRTESPIAGHPLDVVLDFHSHEELSNVQFMFTIFNHLGIAVTHCNGDAVGRRFRLARGDSTVVCRIPNLPLPHGQYRIAVLAQDHVREMDGISTACVFDVESSDFFPNAYMPPIEFSTALVKHDWQLTRSDGKTKALYELQSCNKD